MFPRPAFYPPFVKDDFFHSLTTGLALASLSWDFRRMVLERTGREKKTLHCPNKREAKNYQKSNTKGFIEIPVLFTNGIPELGCSAHLHLVRPSTRPGLVGGGFEDTTAEDTISRRRLWRSGKDIQHHKGADGACWHITHGRSFRKATVPRALVSFPTPYTLAQERVLPSSSRTRVRHEGSRRCSRKAP